MLVIENKADCLEIALKITEFLTAYFNTENYELVGSFLISI